jgi:SNW domain-containing protein 1
VSAKDQADWKVPPCVSNWKNAKGYTIPLDKRLAADGRGLVEVTINDGFAKLSESLYVAEARAREAVETRAKIQRELLAKEKDRKEDELRALAQQARMARVGGAPPAPPPTSYPPQPPASYLPPPPLPAGGVRPRAMEYDGAAEPPRSAYADDDEEAPFRAEQPQANESEEARRERLRRDEIREERRRERERERRLEARDAHGAKRSKLTRDRERDVSERVALGQANVGASRGGEALYDQRLFNQDAGLDAGFGADDSYNTFSKPLFADKGSSLYAPGRSQVDAETTGEEGGAEAVRTDRFRPDRGFAGAEATGEGAAAAAKRHTGPVVFERPAEAEGDDPFGLGQFFQKKS